MKQCPWMCVMYAKHRQKRKTSVTPEAGHVPE